MELRITTGEVDDVAVLWLDGRIVLGAETQALRETVKLLLAQGNKKIVLNMNNVTLIDSAGLGALASALTSARVAGASLCLCHLGAKFAELMQLTRLLTFFEVVDTQADAIHSLAR